MSGDREHHTCGDSSRDPGDCIACAMAPRQPSAESYAKAAVAMGRTERGICVSCGLQPAMEEATDCRECRGED